MYDVPRKTLLVLESEPKAAPFDSHLEPDSRRQCSQEGALKMKQLGYTREWNQKKKSSNEDIKSTGYLVR